MNAYVILTMNTGESKDAARLRLEWHLANDRRDHVGDACLLRRVAFVLLLVEPLDGLHTGYHCNTAE